MFTIVYVYICTVFTTITLLKPITNIIQMWGKFSTELYYYY